MPIIPPGFADVSVQITHALVARPMFVTFGSDFTAAGGDFQGAVNQLRTGWASNWTPALLDSSVVVGPFTARVGQDGGDPLIVVNNNGNISGVGSRTSEPQLVAELVTKQTALGGRRGRGRMFMPWWLQDGDVDEAGIIAAGTLSAHNSIWGTLLANYGLNNVDMVLLHSAGESLPPAPTLVTALTVSSLISSQRRRLGR